MTALASTQTQQQTTLWGDFVAALDNLKTGIERVAAKFQECKAAGIDMSARTLEQHGIPRALVFRLEKIAAGRLLPTLGYRLLSAPDATVDVLSTLPRETQETLAADGVPVWRNGVESKVPLEEVAASEARRLVDPVSGRLLPPKEQAARATKPVAPKRNDQRVEVLLTREQYNELARAAERDGEPSVSRYIQILLVRSGAIKPQKRSKPA
jgi:hypothetical protein